MLQYLKTKFRRSAPSKKPSQDVAQLIKDVPRYPPFMKGLPVVEADALLASQAELVGRIKGVLGYPQATYESLVAPVLQRYAEFVHLLPASEAHHHRGAGGLLRHGLEVAYWAAQASEAQIFPHEGAPREKAEHEMRWRLAAFLAGLCHDLGKPISDMEVSDEDGHTTWDPWQLTLLGWATSSRIDRYFVRWRSGRVHKRHEQFSQLIFKEIAGNGVLSYLSAIDKRTLPALMEAISGVGGRSEVLSRLVMMADQESVSRDMKNNRLEVDENAYGVPIHRYVFDAMRALVNDRTWTVNEPGAKVWVLQDGAYIVWKAAVKDIIKKIQEMSVPGVPRDADTLADILIDRGYALQNEVTTGDGEVLTYRYWKIEPETVPAAEGGGQMKFDLLALRLDSPDRIFTGDIPPAVRGSPLKQDSGFSTQKPAITDDGPVALEAESSTEVTEQGEKAQSPTTTQTEKAQSEQKQQADNAGFLPPDLRGVINQLKKSAPPIPPLEGAPQNEAADEGDQQNTAAASSDLPETQEPPAKPRTDKFSGGPDALPGMSHRDKPKTTIEATDAPLSELNNANSKPNEGDKAEAQLKALLAPAGRAGRIIEQLVQPIVRGEQWLGQSLMKVGTELVILYPEGLKPLGNPIEMVGELYNAGLIVPDPVMKDRKIRDINDVKAVVLIRELAVAITKVLEHSRDEVDKADPMRPKSPSASTSSHGEPNKAPRHKAKRSPAVGVQIKSEERAPNFATQALPDERPSIPDSSTHGESGLKAEPPAWFETMQEDDTATPEVVAEHEPEQRQRTKRTAPALDMHAEVMPDNAPMVPDDAFQPRTITVEDACTELVQMMIAGKGRWLVSAVRKEGGMLVTDIGALERMLAEYPSCLSRGPIRQKLRFFGGFIRAKEIYVKEKKNVH